MTAIRLPAFLARPIALVVAQRRIAQLKAENAELVRKLEITQGSLSSALDDLVELRRHRAALAHAVRSRSSLNLPADLVVLIEEGALGE